MYSYIDLTVTALNCRLLRTWYINYVDLTWRGSLKKLLRLQFNGWLYTHISRKNRIREKPKPQFSVQNRTETEPKMKS